MSKKEAYVHGRKEGVKDNQNKIVRKGTISTIDGAHDGAKCDSGSHNAELASAASAIYSKAVKNGGGSGDIGDKAIKTR